MALLTMPSIRREIRRLMIPGAMWVLWMGCCNHVADLGYCQYASTQVYRLSVYLVARVPYQQRNQTRHASTPNSSPISFVVEDAFDPALWDSCSEVTTSHQSEKLAVTAWQIPRLKRGQTSSHTVCYTLLSAGVEVTSCDHFQFESLAGVAKQPSVLLLCARKH